LRLPSDINRSAEHCSASELIAPEPSDAWRSDSGIAAVSLPSPAHLKESLRARVLEGFRKVMTAREPLAALQALSRFRILCALRQGPFGVEALNRLVEEILAEGQLPPQRAARSVARA
jgi:hypothetical protein